MDLNFSLVLNIGILRFKSGTKNASGLKNGIKSGLENEFGPKFKANIAILKEFGAKNSA